MKKKEQRPPMYFTSLEIENVKCFGKKQKLNLCDESGAVSRWVLILGNNGTGKTSLLKSLCWMQPVEETDEKKKNEAKISKVAIKPYMDDFETEAEYENLIKVGSKEPTRIGVTLSSGVAIKSVPKKEQLVSYAINIRTIDGKLEEIKCEFGELQEFNAPNLFAYNASRHMTSKDSENEELKSNMYNLFSEGGDLYDAEQLLTMLDNASIRQKKKGKASDLLKKVKAIAADLLPDIKSGDDIIINSPINEDGSINKVLVEIKTSGGKIKLGDLSLGYKTMFAWTVDLAVHMLWNNRESDMPLEEPSVVIIDEIDLHLHPQWQRIVRVTLTKHFPNTQFICTAHSPIMAQSAENENLAVIKRVGSDVFIQNNPDIVKGWRIGQILTSELFDIGSERPSEIEAFVNERRQLLDKKKITEADSLRLNELDSLLSNLPILDSDNQRLFNKMQKLAEIVEQKGGVGDSN
jgi:predicted ATP-binding protein involved in virulence